MLSGALTLAIAIPIWRYFPHGQFMAGVFVGGVCGMVQWIWGEPPEFIAKWKRGADGERRTERVLRKIERHGWHSVHDREGRYGNLDHVVVGPGGVFLLDSKNLSGTVTLGDSGLETHYQGAPRDGFTYTRLAGAVSGAAAYLRERIAATTKLTYWVQAVVVVWGEFTEPDEQSGNVTYVSGEHLENWLLSQPLRLSARDRQLIALGLDAEIVVPRAAP